MAAKILRCDRCNRRCRKLARDWNVVMKQGVAVGLICPGCQAPAEDIEAQVNEATLDYSRGFVGTDGRLYAPAKGAAQ